MTVRKTDPAGVIGPPPEWPTAALLAPWLGAVMWLVVAEALRVGSVAHPKLDAFAMTVVADFATFLAFVTVAGTVIPKLGGVTGLSVMSLRDQLDFALHAYPRLLVLCVAAWLALSWIAYKLDVGWLGDLAPHFLRGFDGVAFDQYLLGGRAWSAVIAALALLYAVERGQGAATDRAAILAAGRRHWPYLLAGVVAVTIMAVPLAGAQQAARVATRAILATSISSVMKNFVFFGFVVGFALLRLAATITILCLALRRSYQRGG